MAMLGGCAAIVVDLATSRSRAVPAAASAAAAERSAAAAAGQTAWGDRRQGTLADPCTAVVRPCALEPCVAVRAGCAASVAVAAGRLVSDRREAGDAAGTGWKADRRRR